MTEEVDINYLPTFERMLKKFNLDGDEVRRLLKKDLQKYVDENPNSLYFPKSGAGIGNVWKLRIEGMGSYRAIYYAIPKTRHFDFILIFPKSKQSNLTAAQKKIIKKIVKQLED